MIIEERPDIAQELLTQAIGRRSSRAEGWHQSDVNQCLRKSVVDRWLREEAPQDQGYPKSLRHLDYDYRLDLKFLRGEGLHHFFSEGKPEFVEYDPDLGWYSIDRTWPEEMTLVTNTGAVYHIPQTPMELKSTDYGMNKPVTEMMTYITQIATYAIKWVRFHLPELGDEDLEAAHLSAFLYIYHNRGDYKGNKPDHRAFKLTWVGHELLEWEREIGNRHATLQLAFNRLTHDASVGGLPTSMPAYMPPIDQHYSFECEAYGPCPLKELMNCPGTAESASWDRVPFVVEAEHYVNPVKPGKKGE